MNAKIVPVILTLIKNMILLKFRRYIISFKDLCEFYELTTKQNCDEGSGSIVVQEVYCKWFFGKL